MTFKFMEELSSRTPRKLAPNFADVTEAFKCSKWSYGFEDDLTKPESHDRSRSQSKLQNGVPWFFFWCLVVKINIAVVVVEWKLSFLTLKVPIPRNGQAHSGNSLANCRRIVWVCLVTLLMNIGTIELGRMKFWNDGVSLISKSGRLLTLILGEEFP